MTDTKLRIFLCHSSVDKPAIRQLYNKLSAEGFEPWLDEKDLLPGQDWQLEIIKALQLTQAAIICLSKQSVVRPGYYNREIKYILDKADEQPEGALFVIPAKLDLCDAPMRLKHLQWVNLFENTGYERLVKSLKKREKDIRGGSLNSIPVTEDLDDLVLPGILDLQDAEKLRKFKVDLLSSLQDADQALQQVNQIIQNVGEAMSNHANRLQATIEPGNNTSFSTVTDSITGMASALTNYVEAMRSSLPDFHNSWQLVSRKLQHLAQILTAVGPIHPQYSSITEALITSLEPYRIRFERSNTHLQSIKVMLPAGLPAARVFSQELVKAIKYATTVTDEVTKEYSLTEASLARIIELLRGQQN